MGCTLKKKISRATSDRYGFFLQQTRSYNAFPWGVDYLTRRVAISLERKLQLRSLGKTVFFATNQIAERVPLSFGLPHRPGAWVAQSKESSSCILWKEWLLVTRHEIVQRIPMSLGPAHQHDAWVAHCRGCASYKFRVRQLIFTTKQIVQPVSAWFEAPHLSVAWVGC